MSDCDSQNENLNTRAKLLALYTRLANDPDSDFGWGHGKENARALGYADEWLSRLPECVWESAAAVGNPFSLGAINLGETVVDVGCGAGTDACVAALLVGSDGSVFGIDCTPAMIDKATRNAAASGLTNVFFHEAEMAELPLPDACADVVISNGAINLAENKDAAGKGGKRREKGSEPFSLDRLERRLPCQDVVWTMINARSPCLPLPTPNGDRRTCGTLAR